MYIYLPIFKEGLRGKQLDLLSEENPGVGGTQHVTLILASRLAQAMPDWKVILVNNYKINLLNYPENLGQEIFLNFDLFIKFFSCSVKKDCRAIIIAGLLKKISFEQLKSVAHKTFCWIHHPFDFVYNLRKAKFLSYICVGQYQYLSNKYFYPRCSFIQNVFPRNAYLEESIDLNKFFKVPLRIVHIGALVPGKGFLEIAKQWKNIKKTMPDVRLDVIGSSITYNLDTTKSNLIPAQDDYAKLILKYIPEKDIREKKVIFHGNLGSKKKDILRLAHLALQNPTGRTEAFPASPLECMSYGIPVIASSDYGMNDTMKFFPELSIKKPKHIKEKILLAFSNEEIYRELVYRSLSVSRMFSFNSEAYIRKWIRLIKSDVEDLSLSSKNEIIHYNENMILLNIRIYGRLIKITLNKFFLLLKQIINLR